jgi:nucleotide-binding universal stress UspA family protein
MYQHILLAVALQPRDEVDPYALAARQVALTLAKGARARLTVLSAYEYGTLEAPLNLSPEETARFRETEMGRMDEMIAQKMKAFLTIGEEQDILITPMLQVGEPRELIVDTAEALGADLLVIGARGQRSILEALLGGTATYISRHAPCPVVMVQPTAVEKHETAARP